MSMPVIETSVCCSDQSSIQGTEVRVEAFQSHASRRLVLHGARSELSTTGMVLVEGADPTAVEDLLGRVVGALEGADWLRDPELTDLPERLRALGAGDPRLGGMVHLAVALVSWPHLVVATVGQVRAVFHRPGIDRTVDGAGPEAARLFRDRLVEGDWMILLPASTAATFVPGTCIAAIRSGKSLSAVCEEVVSLAQAIDDRPRHAAIGLHVCPSITGETAGGGHD